jgi:hypothetical protein
MSYPLRQFWCRDCTLSQIDYVVPGDVVIHPNHPYRSDITKELAIYQDAFVQDAVELGLKCDDLVVDVWSNDDALLVGFKQRRMRVLGLEPTNIARIAEEQGIETVQVFFDEEAARKIVETRGQANWSPLPMCSAHGAQLGGFVREFDFRLVRSLAVDDTLRELS